MSQKLSGIKIEKIWENIHNSKFWLIKFTKWSTERSDHEIYSNRRIFLTFSEKPEFCVHISKIFKVRNLKKKKHQLFCTFLTYNLHSFHTDHLSAASVSFIHVRVKNMWYFIIYRKKKACLLHLKKQNKLSFTCKIYC